MFFFRFFCMKKYALFRVHFYKPVFAADCYIPISDIVKNFVYEQLERYFKIMLYRTPKFPKFFFSQNFYPVCDSLVSVDMNIQKCGRKRTYFSWRRKNGQKWIKNRYCVNPPKDLRFYKLKKFLKCISWQKHRICIIHI